MNQVRVGISDLGITFRANVGKVFTSDGKYFDTGLPKGFSDLFGFRKSDGKIFFIEVKTATGTVRKEQQQFIERMQAYGCLAGVARSVEDAREILAG